MGVYLSSPVTDKESIDEKCERFVYGASRMQGWRTTQEDAHNCIPVFDAETKTSFFAVYDGHGGSEVAKYCEIHFPDFVKKMMKSCDGGKEPTKFIQNAFLAFDATLTNEEVIKELKELAGKDDEAEEEEEDDPVGRTETDRLKEEADMPLDQLLAQYNTNKVGEDKKEVFQSPALRAKIASAQGAENKDSIQSKENCEETSSLSSSTSPPTLPQSSSASSSSSVSSHPSVNAPTTIPNGKTKDNNPCNSSPDSQSQASSGGSAGDSSSSSSNSNNNNIEKADSSTSSEAGPGGSGGSSSGAGSSSKATTEEGSSGRASKKRAEAGMAANAESSDDDDDEDDEEEEDMWEDMSDDEDEEEEEDEEADNEEEYPMMDMTNEEPGSDSGCTACVALIQDKRIIVANSGDSRCVLARAGKAVELSFDHKPEDDIERERIEKAGGKVTADGRVNGGLNLSRAIGDHVYKRKADLPAKDQMITALPDIETTELGEDDQFVVIACDGIWNYMSSQEVVDYVLVKLRDPEKRKSPSIICEELFDHCLAPNTYGDGTGCDNMTCILIVLDSFKPTDPKAASTEVTVTSSSGDQSAERAAPSFPSLPGSTSSQEGSSAPTQSSNPDSTDQSTKAASLKRCAEDLDAGEGKRLKRGEEVV